MTRERAADANSGERTGEVSGTKEPSILSSWSDAELAALREAVDESDYSLNDWIGALGAFEAWLAERGEERRPWREIVGYIHCCTLMASPGVALGNLEVVVNKSLIEFGFDFMADPQV